MTRYLLDTNVVSELGKPKPHRAVVAWMKTLRAEQIFLSAVTIGELQAGGELTRRNDTAKALEIEAWLTMVEASFAVAHELGMLSGMGAANGGEEATLDGRRNDCRHGPGSRLGCGHAKTSETSGSFR